MRHGRIQVVVVDGQDGGIEKTLIKHFKQVRSDIVTIALSTNAMTTANMIKGGANDGAIGENAVAFNAAKTYTLAGLIGILMLNDLLGELTSKTMEATDASDAAKIVVPSRQCNIRLADGINRSIRFCLGAVAQIFEEEIRALKGL